VDEPLTILVPARDEEAVVGTTVARLRKAFPAAEVIVADDGSRDRTAEVAEEAGAVVLRLPRRGKGQALSAAERAAPPGTLLLCDADLQGELDALLHGGGDLNVAVFAERVGGGFGLAKRVARELIELLGGLEEALAGHGRLFLLGGEPGIGKSRLADELAQRARAVGFQFCVGRCWEAGGAPPFWPWVQSLRSCIRDWDRKLLRMQLGPGAAELAEILPELRELFPDLRAPPEPDSAAARFRLFDACAQFVRNVAERRPLLLVLDDLHAADAPSLRLL